MRHDIFRAATVLPLLLTSTAALSADVFSGDTTSPAQIVEDRWEFSFTPYFWMATLGGRTAADDSFDMPFNEVLENLNFAFMASVAAEKGRLGFYSDNIYMRLSGSHNATGNIVGNPVDLNLKAQVQGFISTNAVGYKVVDTHGTEISGYGGFRYLWLDVDLDFSLPPFSASADKSGHVFDGVVGFRGETKLTDKLSLAYLGDIGAGQSDLTWQAFAALGYEFEHFDLFAGYRYMYWQLDDTANLDEFKVHGPVVGLRFRF